jgi:hypothetical protein
MNPYPFIFYRDELLRRAAHPASAPIASKAVVVAAAPAVAIEVGGVIVRVPPGADMGSLTEVLRAVRRSAHSLDVERLTIESGGQAPAAVPTQDAAGRTDNAGELVQNREAA